MVSSAVILRSATPDDLPEITRLYGHYVATSTATFDTEPPSVEKMAGRMAAIRQIKAPFLVAEIDGELAGYAYATAYRPRPAYAGTVENSLYLAPHHTGRGLGRLLLNHLIADCQQTGFRQMIAVVAGSDNIASLALHQSCGFVVAGRLTNVGYKFDRWLDTTLLQRPL